MTPPDNQLCKFIRDQYPNHLPKPAGTMPDLSPPPLKRPQAVLQPYASWLDEKRQQRIYQIQQVVNRCIEAGEPIAVMWIEEYNQHAQGHLAERTVKAEPVPGLSVADVPGTITLEAQSPSYDWHDISPAHMALPADGLEVIVKFTKGHDSLAGPESIEGTGTHTAGFGWLLSIGGGYQASAWRYKYGQFDKL